jgi:hypothetical protein
MFSKCRKFSELRWGGAKDGKGLILGNGAKDSLRSPLTTDDVKVEAEATSAKNKSDSPISNTPFGDLLKSLGILDRIFCKQRAILDHREGLRMRRAFKILQVTFYPPKPP